MRKIKGHGVGERAVIGRFRRLGGTATFGEILLYDRGIDTSEIFSLSEDISAIVAVGKVTDAAAVAIKARGMSAVFISEEDADAICEGERAVIYPERDTIFIAPKIEIVDDFSTRMRSEIDQEPKGRERFCACRELFSGKIGMWAMAADANVRGEDAAYRLYKKAAEDSELERLIILLDVSDFIVGEALRAHIKGVIRAAIYTKLTLAVSVRSINEYEKITGHIKGVANELRESGIEVPDGISCGVVINNASVAVCAEEYTRASDIVVIDSEGLLCGVSEEERGGVLCGYLDVVFGRLSGHVSDVVIMGDKQLIEKCLQRISAVHTDLKRLYFLMENKNIK